MAPKKFTEDLLEALADSRVVAALTNTWSVLLDKIIAPMKEKIDDLEVRVSKQSQDIIALKDENVVLRTEIDELEKQARVSNLIFKGLPESSYAEVSTDSTDANSEGILPDGSSADRTRGFLICKTTAIKFFNERLDVKLDLDDISFAYRMKKSERESHRPLFVHFSNTRARDMVYNARVRLKDSGIFINEHLTRMTSSLFAEARNLVKSKKLLKTWTMNGVVYIVKSPGSKPFRIKQKADLLKML